MKQTISFVYELVSVYTKNRISRSAAEFSYFITLTIFPLFICITAVLPTLNVSGESIITLLNGILPEDIIDILNDYMQYVTRNYSENMFFVGIIVMVTSSAGAMRSLINIMTDIQGEARYKGLWGFVISFAFSLGLLITFYLSLAIITTGGWFIEMLDTHFHINQLAYIWKWLRFVILFFIMILAITFLYSYTSPSKKEKKLARLPGAFAASLSIVIFSIIFSSFISFTTKYSVVYGSLSAIIILMVWAYIAGTLLIMGNVLNIVILRRKMHSFKPRKKLSDG